MFVINRYDREKLSESVVRIHQEDFCQALGLPANRKYQESGGPCFQQCRVLIDEYLSDEGADIRINLTRIMIFNYLIGNHDAHGKNFSILYDRGLKLAPFYDLVSTQVYPSLDTKFAMSIGQTYRLDRVKEHSFRLFSKEMNIRPGKLAVLMNEIYQSVYKTYTSLLADHEKKYGGSRIYSDLSKVIQSNLNNMNRYIDVLGD